MGTGIIAVALHLDRRETASDLLLALAALLWLLLAAVLGWRAVRDRARLRAEAHSPGVLTGVAATAVLGVGAVNLDWRAVGIGLLGAALVASAAIIPIVCRSLPAVTAGDAFMLTVASESVAVLAATIATREHAAWLTELAAVIATAGVVVYLHVLRRFDVRTLVTGDGEQWVAGGSVAICALAAGQIALSATQLSSLRAATSLLEDAAIVLWVTALMWLPPLVFAELCWPRLHYGLARWSTVFPLGMYAVCSFAVGRATGGAAISDFARGWIWVAVAGWVTVFAGMLRRGMRLLER